MAAPKKMQDRQRITLYVDAEQKARLDCLAAKQSRPWAEFAREGIDLILTKYKRKGDRR